MLTNLQTPETLREIAPSVYEAIGARTFTIPSRTNGPWHLVTVHNGTATCRDHGPHCWAARKALTAAQAN